MSIKELYKKRIVEKLSKDVLGKSEEYYEYIKNCIYSTVHKSLGTCI